MVLSILDNILLGSLKKFRGDTFEERAENVEFFFFCLGVILAFFGMVLMLAPMFIGTILVLLGATNIDLSWVDSFVRNELVQGIVNFVIAGVGLIILGFLLKKYLQGIIKKHAYIESTKVEEKEIYNLGSEVELSIYAESLSIDKKPISTNKSFSHNELNTVKDRRVIIEAFKGESTNHTLGGKAEILLINKDEITSLNVPEEALVYNIEKVLLTKEITQRVCDFIKEETAVCRTKIFLSASVDEDMMRKIKNQQELDALLHL